MYSRSFVAMLLWMTIIQRKHKQKQLITLKLLITKRDMETKSIWQKILHIAITILTAIATTLGTTSCLGV